MMEVVVTTGAISRAKLQSNHHQQQTNKSESERKSIGECLSMAASLLVEIPLM